MYSVNTTQNSLFLAEGSTVLKVQTRNLGCIFAALASSASASTWLPNDADFYLHDLLTPCHPCPDSSSVQFSSVVQSCPTLCDPMNCSTPGLPVHCQLPEFTQTHPSIQWCYPAISSSVIPFPQSLPASKSFPMSQLFTWGSQSTGVSALASFLPKNTQISFRMDWLDFLAVHGTLKSLLQHHSSKASILQCSAFFTVQLSHPYMTTGKTIALTRWIFIGKVMSLLLNMLSRLVITFLPRSLLISWLQSLVSDGNTFTVYSTNI